MAYTLDTKVGDLLKDTHAVDVLEKYVPGITNNPMVGMASGMTIKSLLAMPQAQQYGITEEKVQQVLKEINGQK